MQSGFLRVAYVVVAAFVRLFLAAVLVAPLASEYGSCWRGTHSSCLLALLCYPTLRVVAARSVLPALRDFVFQRILPTLRRFACLFHVLRRASGAIWSRCVPLLCLASVGLFIVGIGRFHDPETGFTY